MKRWTRHLYFWILVSMLCGVILGLFMPAFAMDLKFLSDFFIALVRMLIGPIIFCTVTLGMAGSGKAGNAGRVGAKAIFYFEVLSTLALFFGLAFANGFKPGSGVGASSFTSAEAAVQIEKLQSQPKKEISAKSILLEIVPKSFFAPLAEGDLLQVLFVALLFGGAMLALGERARFMRESIHSIQTVFFSCLNIVMKFAPIAAGAALAFTVGKFGGHSLGSMAQLMLCFYGSCLLFFASLAVVTHLCGFSFFLMIKYLKDELLLVLATSSSESALGQLLEKLERLGCKSSTVGLVVPLGYSFNLDGTNIYLSLATLFIAQAYGVNLSWHEQFLIIGTAMLTSKGASGVTGAGFITLAATLSVIPRIPLEGLALIIGIDRLMSEARSITNFIGNAVAALVISRWEGDLSAKELHDNLASSQA